MVTCYFLTSSSDNLIDELSIDGPVYSSKYIFTFFNISGTKDQVHEVTLTDEDMTVVSLKHGQRFIKFTNLSSVYAFIRHAAINNFN